jgi:hypothetical protein
MTRHGTQLEVLSRSAKRLLEGHPLCAPDGVALLGEVVRALDATCCLYYARGPAGAPTLGFQSGVASTLEGDAGVAWVSRLMAERALHESGRGARASDPEAAFLESIGLDTVLCCPLHGMDGALGALLFGRTTADPFDDRDRAFASGIAAQAALGIEREAADRALHERERRLAVLSDQIAGYYWTTDTDPRMRLTSIGGRAIRAMGIESSSVVGRLLGELSEDAARAGLPRHVRALAGETLSYESSYGGRLLQSVIVPSYDASGALTGTIGIALDVTSEREADRLRLEASDNMADAQRLGRVGSWAIRLDERGAPIEPHYWSDQYFRIFGYEPGEVVPSLSLVFGHCHPDDRHLLPTSMPEGSDVYENEFRVVQKGGDVRHLSSRTRLFRHPETGAALRVVGTTQDVTERVLAKQALAQLNAELELRVEDRTAELSAANRELEAFAYAVSHDLRAPLRAMSGFSRALIEDYGDVLSDEGKGFLGHIIDGSKRMADLIDGLLHLARLSRGELVRERVDVSALAADVFAELSRSEPSRNIRFEVSPSLRARGDERLLRSVVQNLIGNAIKYTEARDPAVIRVYEEARDGQHCIVVSDNGAGFDMAHHGKLFRPFSRLHRESEFAGLGLGLATVERVVRRHGGGVFAEGVLGVGALFGFWLPSASGGLSEVA